MNLPESSERSNQRSADSSLLFIKKLFAKNPFYILSACLLLYGIYRLSIDNSFFSSELKQLFFNFGSLQFYEVLLVGTAIVLARRKIWYDSAMLVWLENLFLFIPFILISQALLIENKIAIIFCFAACVLVVVRFSGLKKLVPANIPPKLLLFGGILLFINVSLPLLFRSVHENASASMWDVYANIISKNVWLFLLPLLLGFVNLFPRTETFDPFALSKGWFPLVAFGIWITATTAHLYCIDYVYGLKWSISFLAPLLWITSWSLRNRITDFDLFTEEAELEIRHILLIPPVIVPLLAARREDWPVFFTLTAFNTTVYILCAARERTALSVHLAFISAAFLVGGMPDFLLDKFNLHFSRPKGFGMSIATYFLLCAWLSRNPKLGIFGSLISAISTAIIFQRHHEAFHLALEAGFLFLVLHSFRWEDDRHDGANKVRSLATLLWVVHAVVWVFNDGTIAATTTISFACSVLALYSIAKWLFGLRPSSIVAFAALIILFAKPAHLFHGFVKAAPGGLLAITASFVLFAAGTVAALTKKHWHKNERPIAFRTQTNTSL